MIYAYGENYCFMPAPYEIRRLYREGKLGEFEYAEGEYIHNCESIWPAIAYGDPDHWRNNMYATFYCTHSLGPIVHITGLRPVSVTGFEGGMIARHMRTGAKGGSFGIEMVTFENGGICKSIHGGLYKNSIWYTFYGSKGRAETAREDPEQGDVSHIYVNADEYDGEYPRGKHAENYYPNHEDVVKHPFGHGGSDYYVMWNFVEKIKGNPDADTIDVYEALDMSLPGMFAYRSVLNGGVPTAIPNLRDKAVRDRYRNDTMCSDPKAAGEMLIPAFSKGNPVFDPGVYEHQKQLWLDELAGKDGTGRVNGYLGLAMNNGAAAKKQKQE